MQLESSKQTEISNYKNSVPVRFQVGELQSAWIELLSQYRWDLYGTLTFPESKHPEAAYKLFRLFISQLNRKIWGPRWYKHGKGIAWCVALEYQRRGVVHFHCLLAEPALLELHKASWYQAQNGRWQNELNEMWLELAGFARVHRIANVEAVQQYVSKYVVKGGEIELGGPLSQRRIDQGRVRSIVNPGPSSEATDGNNSDSVPVLPGGAGQVISVGDVLLAAASNLPSIRGCFEQTPKGQADGGVGSLPQMSLGL